MPGLQHGLQQVIARYSARRALALSRRNECQAVVETSEENLFNLRPSTGVAYFEAICLRGKWTTLQ